MKKIGETFKYGDTTLVVAEELTHCLFCYFYHIMDEVNQCHKNNIEIENYEDLNCCSRRDGTRVIFMEYEPSFKFGK